jgi:hypothetical protein
VCLVGGVGVSQDVEDVSEGGDEALDVRFGLILPRAVRVIRAPVWSSW